MTESAQTAADRKAVRSLGGQLRLGGIGLILTSLWGTLQNSSFPTSNVEVGARSGILALGLYATTKMAGGCINAAKNAMDPIESAKYNTRFAPFTAVFMLAVSHMYTSALSDAVKERMLDEQPEIVQATPDPLAGATHQNFNDVDFKENPDCPQGTSVITFDKQMNRALIMECTGP